MRIWRQPLRRRRTIRFRLCEGAAGGREFAYDANLWVVQQLSRLHPELTIDIPVENGASERRIHPRAD
ncbi:MAG: hypothetical protein HT580_03225 [Dechloromonas sp.]|nr:MAG: hypothetical protein HT580_03225 [Dechloromonas sp.]